MRAAAPDRAGRLPSPPRPRAPQTPIPEGPQAAGLEPFIGAPAPQRPVEAADPPRHPFMAPNGALEPPRRRLPDRRPPGPGAAGQGDAQDRDVLRRRLRVGDVRLARADRDRVRRAGRAEAATCSTRRTLATLATFPLPPRVPGGGNVFNDFAGGGYFYLDERDRAVIPTTSRHLFVVAPERLGLRAGARLRPHRRRRAGRQDRLRAAGLERAVLVRLLGGRRRDRRPRLGRRVRAPAGRADHELVRGRRGRRRLRRHRDRAVPVGPRRRRRAGRDVARGVRELRASPSPGRSGPARARRRRCWAATWSRSPTTPTR